MSDEVGPSRSFVSGSVSRDAAWSFLYKSVVRLATAGLSIVVARHIGSAGAGAFGIVLQVCALGSLVAAFNLPQGLTKKLAEVGDSARQRSLQRAAWTLVMALSVAVATAVSGASGWLGARVYHDAELAPVLAWCGPLIVATTSMELIEGTLQGLGRFDRLARWGSVLSIFDLVGGAIGAWWGVAGVIISRSLVRAGAVAFALHRWILRGAGGSQSAATPQAGPAQGPREASATLLAFAGPALLSALIVLGAQIVLRLLLVRRTVLDDAGYYYAADSVAQGLLLVPSAVSLALMPAVSRLHGAKDANLPKTLRNALERVAGFNLALCLVFIGCAPWVVQVLFGQAFQPAGPVAVLLAVAYGLAGPCAVLGAAMLGRGEVWRAAALNLIWAVVVLTTYGLTPGSWGASGAAAAVGIGYVGLTLVYVVWIMRAWKVVSALLPAMSVTVVSLVVAGGLALLPGVPTPLTVSVCLSFALVIAWRWGIAGLPPGIRGWLRI